MEFRQINTNTREGKLLVAALAQLSVTEQNEEVDVEGTFAKVEASARVIYEDAFDKEDPNFEGTIRVLQQALGKDKTEGSYYYAWQSNIAMNVYDCLTDGLLIPGSKSATMFHKEINRGAKRFLDLLISQ